MAEMTEKEMGVTVSELIERLKLLPGDLPVVWDAPEFDQRTGSWEDEFAVVETAEITRIARAKHFYGLRFRPVWDTDNDDDTIEVVRVGYIKD